MPTAPFSPAGQHPEDLALRVLRLEQQIEAYQRLHAEELDDLRRVLSQIKLEVLTLAKRAPSPPDPGGEPAKR